MITINKNHVWFLFVVLFLFFAMSLWGFYTAIYPLKINSSITPAAYNLEYETVQFRTPDNIILQGWFIPAKKPNAKTIILLHGYGADKGNILPSRLFLNSDYNLFFFDFRYFGESGGDYSTAGADEIKDLRAAIDYLKSRGINEVGVWGLSMGGAVALMSAVQMKEIKAVVAESSYARLDLVADNYYQIPIIRYPLGWLMRMWGYLILGYDAKTVSPMDAVSKLTIPILLFHSRNDALIPISHAVLLQSVLRANPNAEVIIIEKVPHGGLDKDYQIKVREFFGKSL